MQMMMPVFGGPPQNALLRTALSEKCQDELKQSAGGVGPVRKVPVIPRPDREHAEPIKRDANRNRLPGDAGPERGRAAQVDQHERNSGRIDDVIMSVIDVAVRHINGFPYGFLRASWLPLQNTSAFPPSWRRVIKSHRTRSTKLEIWRRGSSVRHAKRSKAKSVGRNSIDQ